MKIIPLEYDAYNRKFKLVHKEDAKWLSDGSVYLLMDFSSKDFEIAELEEIETTLT